MTHCQLCSLRLMLTLTTTLSPLMIGHELRCKNLHSSQYGETITKFHQFYDGLTLQFTAKICKLVLIRSDVKYEECFTLVVLSLVLSCHVLVLLDLSYTVPLHCSPIRWHVGFHAISVLYVWED